MVWDCLDLRSGPPSFSSMTVCRSLLARAAALGIAAAFLTILTTAAPAAIPPPPGGTILVVTSSADGFGRYLPEILRQEGLNEFDVADVGSLSPQLLAGHSVVVLGPTGLDATQAATLTTFVQAGGGLIAMRPAPILAPLLGLADTGATVSEASMIPSAASGVIATPMQFHGTANVYALNGAGAVATLADAGAYDGRPAVSLRAVGAGQAAAFAYDLGRSVVYTRQGNPAWAGQERDGFSPVRSDDLFFGGSEPDWVDSDKVALPQADEQQRLLANLITQMSAAPLPRFSYLPRGLKAAVVLTGDDHGAGGSGTDARFANNSAFSAPGCSVANWECVRSSSYVFPTVSVSGVPTGNELALHPWVSGTASGATNPTANGSCNNFPSFTGYLGDLTAQLAQFNAAFSTIAPPPATSRNHCIVWSDWDSVAQAEAARGIRLDTNYYWWPGSWANKAGLMTGSGFPMRFANTDGSLVDVFQATSQLNDELTGVRAADLNTELSYLSTLLDNAFDKGYYGVFTANNHNDLDPDAGNVAGGDAVIHAVQAKAASRGVEIPIVSARQMLEWLDGRDGSSFQGLSFAGGQLTFRIARGPNTTGLRAMLPMNASTGALQGLSRDGQAVDFTAQTFRGVVYATFDASAGSYVATYPGSGPAVPAGPTGGGSAESKKAAVVQAVQVLSRTTKAPTFPRLKISALKLRLGGGRSIAFTFRLKHTSRVVLTIRNAKGKIVRRIRAPKHKAKTVLRLRWDGRDSKGHFVKPGRYRFTITATGSHYQKTARGSLRVVASS
jgi:hypothetical protein